MPMKPKWIRNRTIASLYRDGVSMDEIAKMYGISRQRVGYIIHNRTAVTPRPRGRPSNRDRARAGLIHAQLSIDIGVAAGADMSEAIAMMDRLRGRAAETESALNEARIAAGLDHPDVEMTRAISQHLDAIGLDSINYQETLKRQCYHL